MVEERYYLGKITSVEDRLLYRIRVSIDNVVDDAMAFPLRGEVDEPKVGDLVLLYNIDPIFQSCYLYSKIKEDNFLGFRSNGKLISITPESITMTVYENDDESSVKARMTMNAAGRAGEARGDEDVPERRFPEFRGRIQGRGPGAGPRGRGGGDLVLLRPSRGRGGLLRRRNRPVGRSAPRAPHRTAHQRGRKARIQAHHRVGLSGQRRQASQRHRGSPDKQRRPAPEGAFHRIGRHQKQQIRKGAASGSRGRKIFDSPRVNRQAAAPPCGGLLVTVLRADHRELPPENATEVPESESSDLAWASGRIAAGMEWILLFPR